MGEKEIIENNKLIAEFMGSPNLIGGNIPFIYEIGEPFPFSREICTDKNILDEIIREVDEFGTELTPYLTWYHNSWDWLMPCIGKISNVCEEPEELDGLKYALLTNNIEEAWKFVVNYLIIS